MELDGQNEPAEQTQVAWKKAGGVWYVASIDTTLGYASGHARFLLRFNEFESNVIVPAKLFHLSALELPVGAGILDRRGLGSNVWRRYVNLTDDDSRRFFDMEAELESLPE